MYSGVDYNATLPWRVEPAPRSDAGGSFCAMWILGLALLVAGWCIFSNWSVFGESTYGNARDLRCSMPPREAKKSDVETLRTEAKQAVQGYVGPAEATGTLPFTPNASLPAGAPYMAQAFEPSEATADFYNTFNPQSLSQMMPSNWRPKDKGCKALDSDEGQFSQFSRYSISPEKVKRSEDMRGMMRLRENTMTNNSKTLGMPNLLHNAVTPLRAMPIGNNQFIFQDSQLRQSYIAAATGSFPSETSC